MHLLSTSMPARHGVIKTRPVKAHARGVKMKMPAAAVQYSKNKVGVDLSTEFLYQLNIFRRDHRWDMRVFRGVLGLSVLNCMRIWERMTGKKEKVWRSFVYKLAKSLAAY